MITGNKGEWSEIYTPLKVITDKKLFAGDSDLKKTENLGPFMNKMDNFFSNETYKLDFYRYKLNRTAAHNIKR